MNVEEVSGGWRIGIVRAILKCSNSHLDEANSKGRWLIN